MSPWQHPQANAEVALGQPPQRVAYRLQYSPRRRSLGLQINEYGLSVLVPTGCPPQRIADLLQARSSWVLKHLHARAQKRAASPPREWAAGAHHPYQGQDIQLQLHPGLPRHGHRLQGSQLQLALPASADTAAIERATLRWYVQEAQRLFTQCLNHHAPRMGVQWRQLSLSQARTRWGSAKADGHIRLHWRLVQMPPELLDYVVVHELAHLHEMNHSPRFWAIVQQHCPAWRQHRAALKDWPTQ